MGLAKTKELNKSGVFIQYWRINMVKVDILANTTELRIDGYISKADALEGKSPIDSISRSYSGSSNPIKLTTDPREYQDILYAKLIEPLPPFTGVNPLLGATIVSDLPQVE